jgi:hypothetical protein
MAARVVSSPEPELRVRRAVPADAPGIVAVLSLIVDERVHSAIHLLPADHSATLLQL